MTLATGVFWMTDLRILVIEQDAKVRKSAVDILRKFKYKVSALANPEELVHTPPEASPEIVLCSMGMVGDIQKHLAKAFPRKQHIQFVQLFSDEPVRKVMDAFQTDNSDCLQVPFTDKTLLLSMERAGERRNFIGKNMRSKKRIEKAKHELERNLSILEADAQAGRHMQQSLLPSSPVITPPYYVAQKICPSLYLSGDFVNYLTALDNFLLFYLLDVSGHGASSAFVTVMVRQLMRRIVRRHVMDQDIKALEKAPSGFLERINQVMNDNDLDKHLTMFAGALNRKKNTLRYTIGAQLPLPILITDGKAEYLEGKGSPVGLFPQGKWQVHELKLPEKFVLIAFSDGVLEKLPQQSLKAKESFMLKKLAHCPADIDKVLPRLGITDTQDLPDDIAVFMLARGYHESV